MPPMSLDAPPAQPPNVTAQTGAPPFAGVGQGMASGAMQGAGGNGVVVAKWQAVEKVLNQISKDAPGMSTYVSRAIAIMQSGLEQLGGGTPPPGMAPGTGPASAKPPDGGSSFPG